MKNSKKNIIIILSVVLALSLLGAGSFIAYKKLTKPAPPPPPATVRVTFPEGSTVAEIAKLLEKNGVCTAQEFFEAVNNRENESKFISQIKNPDERPFLLEGYIFPDTYDFFVGEGADAALSRFLTNTESKLTDEMYKRAEKLGYTMDEILIIASIIQEESSIEDMKTVSSVLHNRLKSPAYPLLQCDATIFYLNDWVNPYLTEDKKDSYNDLYNTYKKKKLPAGPITNPGIEAINAALYPESTDYYFFVTDKDKNYYFAHSFAEHKNNCKAAGIYDK